MSKVKVDGELVRKVAQNAHLNLTDAEARKFAPQLQEILDAFSKLDKLDAEKEEASFQPIEIKNVLREDSVGQCLTQEQALANTKHKRKGYFLGPRVV